MDIHLTILISTLNNANSFPLLLAKFHYRKVQERSFALKGSISRLSEFIPITVIDRRLEAFEMWIWRRMEKIS